MMEKSPSHKSGQDEKSGLGCCSKSSDSVSSEGGGGGSDGGGPKDLEQVNNNHFHLNQQTLREFRFPKRRPVDLEFKDITFTVREYSLSKFRCTKKNILHGVDGRFKSGELTAIMGPSGAGKSTLLNILAGLTSSGVSGKVFVNGSERARGAPQRFQRLSRYIQQDDELRAHLTAGEAMAVAAHLKLGFSLSDKDKTLQVKETLSMLGLEECYNTMTGHLSGGQRKRLAIALELLSNPPVLFLDEPTTGLDSLSCSQCVSLLKRLSQEGRTIVCTIHQPSALLFDMFDTLYALAEGRCIYRGPARQLVGFLGSQGLNCPPFHNPADFLIEVAIGEHNVDLAKLANAATKADEESKSLISRNSLIQARNGICGNSTDSEGNLNLSLGLMSNVEGSGSIDSEAILENIHPPANQLRQTWLLLKRNFLSTRRNYSLMMWRLLAHILIAFLFGYLYKGVGNDAEKVLANYVYLYGTLLLVSYTGKMSVTLQFPLEMEKLKREHFNKWYSLGPYIISTLALEIPFQVICCVTYITISYVMTGNMLVWYRLNYFLLIAITTSLCAQAWGYFVGATTPTKIAVFIGPVFVALFSVFGFCIRYTDTPIVFRWMFQISYFRAGFHSLVYSVYGMARGKLDCFAEGFKYCHYITPDKFLTEMDIVNIDIWGNLSLVLSIGILMHMATAGALWCRLNRR